MIRTLEATIDEQGVVHLLEPIALAQTRRAFVTILEEPPLRVNEHVNETALLSEAALAEDWKPTGGGRGMVTPSVGAVVLVPFPFSDLSESRLRPAVVLAKAGRGDWMLCQITSNAYADTLAEEITDSDFVTGSLRVISYARPGKVFTANQSLLVSHLGVLNDAAFKRVAQAVIRILQAGLPA